MNEDLYRKAMDGIGIKVAMQEIRKVIRSNKNEGEKLGLIMGIVHSYSEDCGRIEEQKTLKALLEDEEQMRREKISDMFDDMTEGLDKLTIRKKGEGK